MLMTLLTPPVHAIEGGVGGYLRVMSRPDMEGGAGQLGHWNLYGRLMNEGPWAALDLYVSPLAQKPGSDAVWTTAHAKIEGAPYALAGDNALNLSDMRITQLYTRVGNVGVDGLVWQVGTLDYWHDDVGLYDIRPTTLFQGTVGASALYHYGFADLRVGVGDAAAAYGSTTSTPTAGGSLRVHPWSWLDMAFGGQVATIPTIAGNTGSPYSTPGLTVEDAIRGEFVEGWLADNPGQELNFPDPVTAKASASKLFGVVGFGGWGPLTWSRHWFSAEQVMPELMGAEHYDGIDYTLYTTDITDERTVLSYATQSELTLIPQRLDLVIAGLIGVHRDGDNDISPSDYARTYRSVVARLQTYATPNVHWLLEGSAAEEVSTNGNQYRNHVDSIFASQDGVSNTRGLEVGDADTRITFQGKTGIVLNPLGPGIFARPSLRLLYGVQYSTQNNAFGNNFVDSLSEFNDFENEERHLHHLMALEAEAWF
jgi:hypothetical protein